MLKVSFFFFFHDTATTDIYTLSLHDALPISTACQSTELYASLIFTQPSRTATTATNGIDTAGLDRKSTRLNSSHLGISYAVFCLKKKNISLQDTSSHHHTDPDRYTILTSYLA